jgi:hypothetical protein
VVAAEDRHGEDGRNEPTELIHPPACMPCQETVKNWYR